MQHTKLLTFKRGGLGGLILKSKSLEFLAAMVGIRILRKHFFDGGNFLTGGHSKQRGRRRTAHT